MGTKSEFQGMVATTQLTTKRAARIKAAIEKFFANEGLQARTLYRTDPARFGSSFGGNCPHNFLPRSARLGHITVYMEFKDADIHLGNFIRIIAFPDVVADTFPRHPKRKNSFEKANLEALDRKYIFHDWDDLKTNYRRILAR